MEGGYHKLEVYQLSHALGVKVHEVSLKLPRFEMHEEGSQIRTSAKSVSSNIVEGYVLRKYKNEFLHYLYRSYGSAEETLEHLQYLYETKSPADQELHDELVDSYRRLNGMLFRFIETVEHQHGTPMFLKDIEEQYLPNPDNMNPES
jgi:four helix bundle protein